MAKKVINIGLILVLFCVVAAGQVGAKEKVIYEQTDAVGDEYGPGTYTYPTSKQFKPYEGLFDLLEFKVTETGDWYNFYFKFAEITNPWQARHGFSHQLIQVYIDNGQGGKVKTFKPGANVRFEDQHPWNKLIKINGWLVEVHSAEDDQDADGRVQRAGVETEDQLIKVSIPQKEVGALDEAHYYVLVGALDGFGYDNYREVIAEATGWKFGGGTDTNLNPNLLDILVPEGMEQKKILAGYDLEEKKLATLRAVGPELSLPVKFIVIFGFAGILLFSLAGIVVKFVIRRLNN